LPLRKWREFSEVLYERFGLPFLLTGDKSEVEYVSEVAKAVVGKKEVIAGKTSISELKRVLKDAYLVVSTDSAPMHIAAVQKTPTIGIFGATNWIVSAPFGPWSVALYDRTLFKDGKPFAKNRLEVGNYYDNIDINEALERLKLYLEQR
jgi:ADP-heptose:LPS heptosyltransferase